jgi:hypothetical protein
MLDRHEGFGGEGRGGVGRRGQGGRFIQLW